MKSNVKYVNEIKVNSVMTKTRIPLGGYAVNPYVGCSHACKYCYASFMKRFTGHKEPWGEFIDVKYWKEISNPKKYDGERIVIGTVTDGYNELEEKYKRTRTLLEELKESNSILTICTKSDLVVRDLDLLKQMKNVTVSWSINTLDEEFKNDMDSAPSIEKRINAMKTVYDAGIRTVCFISPIFPGITNIKDIIEKVKDKCDFIWLENLNLRGCFKSEILNYISEKYPNLVSLYDNIYNKKDNSYWKELENEIQEYAKENEMNFVDNKLPDGHSKKGYPSIINYLYHEEVRGSDNKGTRTK